MPTPTPTPTPTQAEIRAAEDAQARAHWAEVGRSRIPRPPRCRLDSGKLMRREFLDHEPMNDDEAPSCPLEAMKLPRLRKCAFDVSTMVITGQINYDWRDRNSRPDGGLDGYNWKIRFGQSGPFVLKAFWDQAPPDGPPGYYALQRECQNAATLQLMQAALTQDDATLGPILVNTHPWDRGEALESTFAFSDERRRQNMALDGAGTSSKTRITHMPRIRKCYGWIKISSKSIDDLPYRLWPPTLAIEKMRRQLKRDQDYVALVYEFLEEGDNDGALIQESLDFFRQAGFSNAPVSLLRNWKQSVLIDMSDLAYAGGCGWSYWRLNASKVLRAI